MSVAHDMMLFMDRTNHCLVCKVPVDVYSRHKNLNDVVEVAGGRTVRSCLEQVLDVSLAGSSTIWLCNKCYSDLEQIQVYYNLVKHFRDRFHNTVQLQGGLGGSLHHGHGAYSSPQYDTRTMQPQSHYNNPNMLLHTSQQNADMLLNLANSGNQTSSIPNPNQTFPKFQPQQPGPSQTQHQHQVQEQSLHQQALSSSVLPNKKVTDGNFLDNILDLQAIPDVHIKKEVEKIVADSVSGDDTIEDDNLSNEDPAENSPDEHCVEKSDKKASTTGVVKEKEVSEVTTKTIKEDPAPMKDKEAHEEAIECTICEQSFKTETRLKRHMLSHRRSGPFKCAICNKGFTSEKQLKLHTLCHVIDPAPQGGSSDNDTEPLDTKPTSEELLEAKSKGPFTCRICHKNFYESRLLRLHKRTHTSSKYSEAGPMQCPDCEEQFASAEQLKEHLKKESCDWPWKCHLCDAGFIEEIPLKKHLKSHANESRVTCPICHKRLSDAGYMKEHIRTHTGEMPHQCTFCQKRFNNPSNLKSHERIHTGEKPYKCKVCGLAFTQIGQKKVHEMTHAGKAPHVCPTCGKEFYWACSYKKHLQTHSDEKPELCSICGKSFRNVPALHAHARSHSDERPHICSYCGKGFKTSKHLSVHKRIHTGEKPFICELCGRGFSQTTGLKFHLKSHNVTHL